ncbi:MAG: hypothetical protein HC875_39835 [Anaerolineales bacterium]|nr:hypothetical protein [Anaerolineales bacterium]
MSKIAEKQYGDPLTYPAIVEATNAKAAEDSSFAVISDPNVLEAGQKLWLPAAPQNQAAVGIYKALLPAASSPGIDSTLYLNIDSTVRQVEDYLNGEPAIVEVGNWRGAGSQVEVSLSGREGGTVYAAPNINTFTLEGDTLATTPDEDNYGSLGRKYIRFEALATGQQTVAYNPAEAAQAMSQNLAGIYKGFSPAASCCGLDWTLFLNTDSKASLKSDYLNGEAPIVEAGTWTLSDNTLSVTLADAQSAYTFQVADGVLISNDFSIFGEAPLRLYRFDVAARNAGKAFVSGTVSYLQRMALPPQASLTVQLVDVSRADAPAEVISEQVIPANGQQVPFAFALPYDPTAIDPVHTYAIQSRIEADGKLLFITTRIYNVITRGNPTTLEVIMESVGN